MKTKTNLTLTITSQTAAVINGRTDCTSIAERNYPLNGQSVPLGRSATAATMTARRGVVQWRGVAEQEDNTAATVC